MTSNPKYRNPSTNRFLCFLRIQVTSQRLLITYLFSKSKNFSSHGQEPQVFLIRDYARNRKEDARAQEATVSRHGRWYRRQSNWDSGSAALGEPQRGGERPGPRDNAGGSCERGHRDICERRWWCRRRGGGEKPWLSRPNVRKAVHVGQDNGETPLRVRIIYGEHNRRASTSLKM